MAIAYPLVMPSAPGFKEFAWHPSSIVAVQRNEFTAHSKVYKWDGQLRKASVRVGAIRSLTVAKEWQAFFLKLNGAEGSFLMQDPAHARAPDATEALAGTYTAKVDGSGQTGDVLLTKDWPPGISDLLRKGDYIAINVRLYSLLENASSDSNGDAELSIWPHASGDLEDGDELWVGSEAYGKFRLLEFPDFAYDVERLMTEGFSFGCEEVVE